MLTHLKELKEKNHQIQNHIEKTIDKIEDKMKNIIGESHQNKDNIEEFNTMEKEITDILTIMKRAKPSSPKTNTTVPKVTSKNSTQYRKA